MERQNELTLSLTANIPVALEGDEVYQAARSPNHDLDYKVKLASLYTNEPLNNVQIGTISLFQRKATEISLISLQRQVSSLLKQDIGEFFMPFFEERILKKGMWLLREELRDLHGEKLLEKIANIWNYFYTELIHNLQVILLNVKAVDIPIKDKIFVVFRQEFLLKTNIREDLPHLTKEGADESVISSSKTLMSLRQMCLILLSVKSQVSKDYLLLEELCSRLVTPLITQRGVFYNGEVTPAFSRNVSVRMHRVKSAGNLVSTYVSTRHPKLGKTNKTFTLPRMVSPVAVSHSRQRSQPVTFLKELFSSSGSSLSSDSKLSRSRASSSSDLV